jgi:hypothetical protein
MVFSVQSVPTAMHATMEYIMPLLSNNRTAMRDQCFLHSPRQDVTSKSVGQSASQPVSQSVGE